MSSFKIAGSQYKAWFSSAQQETHLVGSVADRDALDKTIMAPGSSCYLDDGTAKWVLGSDMEWHEWPMGGGGGSGLPAVTTDDNGKVLGVADGAWAAVENKPMPYTAMIKLDDYTYEVWYDAIDYRFAKEYFEGQPDVLAGGCSAAFRNGKFIRNYDWKYDNTAQFIVHVAAAQGRHATIGICGGIAELTPEFIDSGVYSDLYRVLPFYMQDGFNDAGLTCCMNVVPRDNGDNRYPVPDGQTEDVCGIMLVRYMLDNMNAVADMETKIPQVGMWFPDSLHGQGYELHYFAADIGQNTTVLEYVENEPVFHDIDRMTNFYIDGVTLNDDGTVYTPYTQDDAHNAMDTNGVTENGSGLERWNIIADVFNNDTYTDIADLCPELFFTKAYTITEDANVWYTEFVGINGMTCATPYDEYADTVAAARSRYEERTREDEEPTWHTVHSTVYDLDNGTMHVIMQEGMSEYDDVKPVGAASLANTVVRTVEQELTEDEKMQARKNQGLYYSEITAEDPIVWNGDTEGRASFTYSTSIASYTYYKVSDIVLSATDVIGGNIHLEAEGQEYDQELTEQDIYYADGLLQILGYCWSAQAGTYFGGAVVVPEDGSYMSTMNMPLDQVSITFPGVETVHQIENKFIPQELPAVTIGDNGKVLGVADGEWSPVNLGSVFKLKGSVATVTDLPATGNEIGDVYYVTASSVGYIWLNDGTEDRWEQLGLAIDLSQYATTQYVDQKIGEIESVLETI